MNNVVTDYNGQILGYRCHRCYEIWPVMWDTLCNKCRHNDDIQKLTVEIDRLKAKYEVDINRQKEK